MDELMAQPAEEENPVPGQQGTTTRRTRLLLAAGVALVVLVLAGAAYVGAGLLRQERSPAASGGRQMVAEMKGGLGGARQVRLDIVPAKELPQTESTVDGVFTRREDNSIFLGTGDIQVMVNRQADGAGSKEASFSGPVVEVVVTHDTQVWQDDTEMLALDRPVTSDELKIQQVVSPGSLDELNENSTVRVWGERRGDRVVATTVVYRN